MEKIIDILEFLGKVVVAIIKVLIVVIAFGMCKKFIGMIL